MAKAIYLVPVAGRVGLTSVAVGLMHALDRHGIAVGFCKPIAQMTRIPDAIERSTHLVRCVSSLEPPTPLPFHDTAQLVSAGREDRLLEEVVDRYEQAATDASVVVVEGVTPIESQDFVVRINARAAQSLDAAVVLVAKPGRQSAAELRESLELAARPYGGVHNSRVVGCILNLVNVPLDDAGDLRFDLSAEQESHDSDPEVDGAFCPTYDLGSLPLLACIPWRRELITPRVSDVVKFTSAGLLNTGNLERRISHVVVGGRALPGACRQLAAGGLLIAPGDRSDLVLAASMAALKGTHLAAVLLTDTLQPDPCVMALCEAGLATGLPVLTVDHQLLQAVFNVRHMSLEVPLDDTGRIHEIIESVAGQLDLGWVERLLEHHGERRLSPPAFRYMLVERARAVARRILLPEGDEPRTIQAAASCQQRGIARCVLLGNADRIRAIAAQNGLQLPDDLEIIDPDLVRDHYVEPLVALRAHKGMTPQLAEEVLLDPVMLGTMMLALDEVDGLVSGAVHTTANTIRPALQLIRTAPDAKLVSSVFFMCLPEQVLVYGDCAVNPDPDAEALADIAIQSANSAAAFGIEPRVAMLSYSTGGSGSGQDVRKVVEATRIARSLRPDLPVDGPLQYDAAAIEAVARTKAPDSAVAGRATVFVFPDLNTGNTTYKAVQRSAHVVSIGPMLQGLAKPVNDLSRGALVEDIVYTIALTAIQAGMRHR